MKQEFDQWKNILTKNSIESQTNCEEYKCPICKDTGWVIRRDDEGRDYFSDCSCGKRQRDNMQGKLDFAEIPESFKDMRLKDFKLSIYDANNHELALEGCKMVRAWLDNLEEMSRQGRGLYIYSHTKGSGKTRLATSLANELIFEHGKTVKFATSMQIINAIKSTWNERNNEGSRDSENKLLNDLATVDYLFIDDFGTEQAKDWIGERFFHIINNRYINLKTTIITSNYEIDELGYDDRIKDRIVERCYEIHFAEQSVRRIIAQLNSRDLRGKANEVKKES